MELIKKHRKEISIPTDVRRELIKMGIEHDLTLKPFIERELEAIAEKGIDYRSLWNECEALRKKLQQLTQG